MEEAYWKQFMATGKVEDYLHFKQCSGTEGNTKKQNEEKSRDVLNAGIGKCDSHCT